MAVFEIMGKKTKSELVEKVISALDAKKNTINEIATHIGSNWSTVKDTLDFLEKYGLVTYYTEKNVKIYTRKSTAKKIEESSETFFKLPVTEEQKVLAHSLFGQVQVEYEKIAHRRAGKIVAQKVIEDLEDDSKIILPSGWYLYGLTSVFSYNPEVDYPINATVITEPIKKKVAVLTKEYAKLKTIEDIMAHQYRKHKNYLYLTKLNLSKLSSKGMNLQSKETKQAIQTYLANFLLYLPKGEYCDEVYEVVNKYVLIMNKLLLGNENLNLIKPYLEIALAAVWKYVATVKFFNDLLKSYKPTELEQVKQKIFSTKQDAIEQIEFISEYYTAPQKLPQLNVSSEEGRFIRNSLIDLSKD